MGGRGEREGGQLSIDARGVIRSTVIYSRRLYSPASIRCKHNTISTSHKNLNKGTDPRPGGVRMSMDRKSDAVVQLSLYTVAASTPDGFLQRSDGIHRGNVVRGCMHAK